MGIRNQYRAVSGMDTYGETWKVQMRGRWLPIWRTVVPTTGTLERAREYAENHARKREHVRRVVYFGVFKPMRNR